MVGLRERLGATVAIWTAFAVTASITIGQITASTPIRTSELTLVGLVLVMALAATLSTCAVWLLGRRAEFPSRAQAQCAEKQRLARLSDERGSFIPEDQEAALASAETRAQVMRQ